MALKEQAIQKKIIDFLRATGGWVAKVIQASERGVPDVVACVPLTITQKHVGETIGLFVAVEVKTAVGDTSDMQDYQLGEIAYAKGVGIVARSSATVLAELEERGVL